MSLLDYHPFIGPYREATGQADNGGGEGGSESFIDSETGQEIEGAYYVCGACDHRPIREGDQVCPNCFETIDWNQIDESGAPD